MAKEQLNRRGVEETIYETYTAGKSDYSALVSKLKSFGVNVIYLGGYHTEAALIIREAYDQGFKPQLLAGDALVTDEFWKIAGKAGYGTMMTFSPDPRRIPNASDIVRKYRARNVEPDGYTLFTYAAIQAWAQATAKASSVDARSVTESLRSNKFDTVLGRIGFDDKGDVVGIENYVWYIWRNGFYNQM
jgi:branched-chain amino acid transport system substrate-binding protein